ncbi:uncharacterized protein [Engystomops pustulosus]|uniref:uncharacterized protein n=2 Tax=Engystomops pustulosus TaxID=76066 RepID=UPI003AFA4153
MASGVRSDLDASHVISLVKERPMLWDLQHKHYASKSKRSQAWIQICKELTSDWEEMEPREQWKMEEQVRTRWRSCRDRFRREVAINEKSGSSPSHKRPYQHFEELLFLLPTRTLRPTQGNIPKKTRGQAHEHLDTDDQTMEQSHTSLVEDAHGTDSQTNVEIDDSPPEPPPINTRQTRRRAARVQSDPISAIEHEAVNMMRRAGSQDMYDGLGVVVAGQCRRFPAGKRNLFIAYVMTVVELFDNCDILPSIDVLVNNLKDLLCPKTTTTQPFETSPTTSLVASPPKKQTCTQTETTQTHALPSTSYSEDPNSSYLQMLLSDSSPWRQQRLHEELQTVTALPASTFSFSPTHSPNEPHDLTRRN